MDKHQAKPDPPHDKAPAQEPGPKKFKASEFRYDEASNRYICPAGKALYSSGSEVEAKPMVFHRFKRKIRDCVPCELREQCLHTPEKTQIRQVAL